jgi:preprotein translocase subunit SecG
MNAFFTSIHVVNCIALIIVVLLQAGKGAGLAGVFGASSAAGAQLFGGKGAGGFLGRLTAILAVVFMFTSIILTLIGGNEGTPRSVVAEQASETPAAPAPMTGTPLPGGSAVPGGAAPSGDAGTATPGAGSAGGATGGGAGGDAATGTDG